MCDAKRLKKTNSKKAASKAAIHNVVDHNALGAQLLELVHNVGRVRGTCSGQAQKSASAKLLSRHHSTQLTDEGCDGDQIGVVQRHNRGRLVAGRYFCRLAGEAEDSVSCGAKGCPLCLACCSYQLDFVARAVVGNHAVFGGRDVAFDAGVDAGDERPVRRVLRDEKESGVELPWERVGPNSIHTLLAISTVCVSIILPMDSRPAACGQRGEVNKRNGPPGVSSPSPPSWWCPSLPDPRWRPPTLRGKEKTRSEQRRVDCQMSLESPTECGRHFNGASDVAEDRRINAQYR